MLSDRNYMRDDGGYRIRPSFGPVGCVFLLIAINVIFFLLSRIFPQMIYLCLTWFGLKHLMFWQLITHMFMHANFLHLFVNMWGLYLFGTVVAPVLGTRRFLIMYFLSGICGALLFLVFNINRPVLLLGASGGVFGVTVAAAMLHPEMKVMLLIPPVPMSMKTMSIVFIALEIFLQFTGAQGGVAHLAHLGGVVGAYLYLKMFYRRAAWDPLGFLFKKSKGSFSSDPYKHPEGWSVGPSDMKEGFSQKELDRILDKISETGINSLSPEEMQYLKMAREEMKNR